MNTCLFIYKGWEDMSYSIMYLFYMALSVSHWPVYNFTAGEDLYTVASMAFINFKCPKSVQILFVDFSSYFLVTNL